METYRKALISAAAVSILAGIPSFLDHYLYFISGQVRRTVIQGRWDFVALNIIAFLLFLIPLNYRRKADWKSMGIYTAFIVSLFVEMYGIPLSVYLSTAVFSSGFQPPGTVLSFMVLGQEFSMNAWMIAGLIITATGAFLVALGWITVYRKSDGLVTSGIYSYSRHPQYVGIVLVAAGWFIGWPTLLTTLLFPVLVYHYYQLSLEEEEEVAEEIGREKYDSYRQETPMFL